MEEKIVIAKTCKTCGAVFTISKGELDWLEEHNFLPFEHCGECRKNRRKQRRQKNKQKKSLPKEENKE